MKQNISRRQLVEKLDTFIGDNNLSVLVSRNHYPGGESTLNLGVIVDGEIALDVAEGNLTLNEAMGVEEYTPLVFNPKDSKGRLYEQDRELISKEVDMINEYLKTLLDKDILLED
jgi:hypothetical protein